MKENPNYKQLVDLKEGDLYSDPAYLSTTHSLRVASHYAMESKTADAVVLMSLHHNVGSFCSTINEDEENAGNGDEYEILFPRNKTFRVRHRSERIESGVHFIYYELYEDH